ncbi:uncharacterized [Tachysurus ichikawai]
MDRNKNTSISKDKAVSLNTGSHLSSLFLSQFLISAPNCRVSLKPRLHMEGQRNFDLHRPYVDCEVLPEECGLSAQCSLKVIMKY